MHGINMDKNKNKQTKTLSFAVISGHKFQITNTNSLILRLRANTGRLHYQSDPATVVREIIAVYCERLGENCVYCTDSVWAERKVFDC
jgi:hypothetical protein